MSGLSGLKLAEEPAISPRGQQDSFSDESGVRNVNPATYLKDPFHAVATDWDGVFADHGNPAVVEELRPLLLENTVFNGVPTSVITGKELGDATHEIIDPIRHSLEQSGAALVPGSTLVYTNNGSNLVDVVTGELLERKEFSPDDVERMHSMYGMRILMDIFKAATEISSQVAGVMGNTEYRQRDMSTLCLRLDTDEFHRLPAELLGRLDRYFGGTKLSRFQIAQVLRREFAEEGMGNVEIHSTDRSVDLTPPGTGKRAALEDFSERTGVSIEDILRIGDSPLGMDLGLLAPKGRERRGGFSNVPFSHDAMSTALKIENNRGFRTPVRLTASENQFENTRWVLERARFSSRSTPLVAQR